jgi:hypothetical protein
MEYGKAEPDKGNRTPDALCAAQIQAAIDGLSAQPRLKTAHIVETIKAISPCATRTAMRRIDRAKAVIASMNTGVDPKNIEKIRQREIISASARQQRWLVVGDSLLDSADECEYDPTSDDDVDPDLIATQKRRYHNQAADAHRTALSFAKHLSQITHLDKIHPERDLDSAEVRGVVVTQICDHINRFGIDELERMRDAISQRIREIEPDMSTTATAGDRLIDAISQ